MNIRDYYAKKKDRISRRKKNARFIAKVGGKKLKPTRGQVRKQLWDLTSLIVRMRDKKVDGGRCLICHERPIAVGYHLVPSQRGDSIRYDLSAVVGGCSPCNYAEYMNRSLYRLKHEQIFGKEYMDLLERKAAKVVKLSLADLIELRDQRKAMLEGGL